MSDNEANFLLQLPYIPPYNWQHLHSFYRHRLIEGLEWIDGDSYGRTFSWQQAKGAFTVSHDEGNKQFIIAILIDDEKSLPSVMDNIKRVLDVDRHTSLIEAHLLKLAPDLSFTAGLRIPGIWSLFEAGIKAILGQQISVNAAKKLGQILVEQLGEKVNFQQGKYLFPTPESISESKLEFLKIPQSRRNTLICFSKWYQEAINPLDVNAWLAIKGIGKWTASYAFMRGCSHPDIFLTTDLGVKKISKNLGAIDPLKVAPWGSYLTFHMWNQ